MIMRNSSSDCQDARVYYYDILCQTVQGDVPAGTLQHVDACPHCQGEIARLERTLNEAEAPTEAQTRRDAALLQLLRLHFSYADQPVFCSAVKSFLPSLADESVRIRIPTPITIHIDQCEQCSTDLSVLRSLALSGGSTDCLARPTRQEQSVSARAKGAFSLGASELPEGYGPEKTNPPALQTAETVGETDAHAADSGANLRFVKKAEGLLMRHGGKIAAAFVISVGLLALTSIPRAEAGRVDLLREALLDTSYFHTTLTIHGEESAYAEERWILRDEHQRVDLAGGQWTLYDLSSRKCTVIPSGDTAPGERALPDHDWLRHERRFERLVGIVSFDVFDLIPDDLSYDEMPPDGTGQSDDRIDDYKWVVPGSGGTVKYYQCLVHTAAGDHFPRKLELSTKASEADDYQLRRTVEIILSSKDEIADELSRRSRLQL